MLSVGHGDLVGQSIDTTDLSFCRCESAHANPSIITTYSALMWWRLKREALTPEVSPEEIMSREVKMGCESWTSFASGCSSQQCNGHCPCDSAQHGKLKQQLRGALVAAQWRGDTALTLPLFWRRSTVSPVFFGRYPRSSLHSFALFLPCPRP